MAKLSRIALDRVNRNGSPITAGTRAERKKGCLDLLPIEPLYREYAARIEKIARRMAVTTLSLDWRPTAAAYSARPKTGLALKNGAETSRDMMAKTFFNQIKPYMKYGLAVNRQSNLNLNSFY